MLIFHMDFNFASLRYEFVKELLDKVASLGYDSILWELENQVRWDSCPECAHPDSWSKAQFRELLDYSRKLNLEPIPLLQTIGHGEYVMMHERYHSFREHPDYSDCYCVSNPEVRKFLRKWIAEYCELFGDLKYFHLGGDEAYRFGSCNECSKRERNELYGEHINFLAADLQAKDIRPGIWGDMILADPDNLDSISRDFIVWDWDYCTGVGNPKTVRIWGRSDVSKETLTPELLTLFPELIASNGELNPFYTSDVLKNRGYDVILCSAVRSYSDGHFCPNIPVHAPNIVGAAAKCRDSKLLGHCVTSWAIRLNPVAAGLPLLALPSLAASSSKISLEDLKEQSAIKYFGFAGGLDAAAQLSSCDNRLRILSAVQWSGLKDSRPAPPNHLAAWIERWIADKDHYWINKDEMFASMRDSTQKGLSALAPYADEWPTAALWKRAGILQLRYIELLQTVFSTNPDIDQLRRHLLEFKMEIADYFGAEQTPDSAARNANLILDPLLDYLKNEK
ncbi:MAG TPA: hypothetical protein DET40_04305 [Lentisphaeria bacterium]|nr:MAG: hypothetical protein A2X45_11330 [Lentisphaerae bacterium GWF2_50_93]HCE42748.1 hypothetical protein [Lentisphaeria bacterium]